MTTAAITHARQVLREGRIISVPGSRFKVGVGCKSRVPILNLEL
jgi:hypothetical protein